MPATIYIVLIPLLGALVMAFVLFGLLMQH